MLKNSSGSRPKIVLIACGSFSPPTPMHFRMFEIAKDYFKIHQSHEVIGGIVSPTHDSYGKKGLVNGKHRLTMLSLGLRSSNWIKLSDWEINQCHWNRTKVVLEYHQNALNNFINSRNIDDECVENEHLWFPHKSLLQKDLIKIKLLCGADLLESFAIPGLWKEEDVRHISFIVFRFVVDIAFIFLMKIHLLIKEVKVHVLQEKKIISFKLLHIS
ncbi:NMNAT1 family protein [Megaselia abdita]